MVTCVPTSLVIQLCDKTCAFHCMSLSKTKETVGDKDHTSPAVLHMDHTRPRPSPRGSHTTKKSFSPRWHFFLLTAPLMPTGTRGMALCRVLTGADDGR